MKKQRTIVLHEPEERSNQIELVCGMCEEKFKHFKPRFKFYFESKENVDDFIDTLKRFSEIAFKK